MTAETTVAVAPSPAKITRLQSYTLGDGPSNSALQVDGTAYARYTSPRNPGPNPDAKHPWERVGLGVAPYKCVGVGTAVYRATPDAPAQPGTTCDYCGQAIMNVFSVQAACKSVFKVGCDCVAKTCDPREGVRVTIDNEARKHRNAQAAVARKRRDGVVVDALAELRADHESTLAAMPHPRGYDGKSALDWLDYMLRACGASGRAKLLKTARAMVADAQPARALDATDGLPYDLEP